MSGTPAPAADFDPVRALALAARTIEIEAQALQALPARQGPHFGEAVRCMLQCAGRVVVLGYVASRGARELIRSDLLGRGYREGRDFLMCA